MDKFLFMRFIVEFIWLLNRDIHLPKKNHWRKILPLFFTSSLFNLLEISAMKNSPLRSYFYHPLYSFWSDTLDPIRSIFSDPTQSNLIFSLIFYPLPMLFSDSLYSGHSNPIQYPLRSSGPLIFLKITYH